MPTCFVIQPFDNGKYDDRYKDIFKPAIEAAGLDPYRLDSDPHATILIEAIESGIKGAAACLVDITENNPNVWFELGYALASGVPVCMVCSDERTTSFPFDVQHRKIIKYKTGSPSNYRDLGKDIATRLKAILSDRADVTKIIRTAPGDTLEPYELAALTVIVKESDPGSDGAAAFAVKRELDAAGFNQLATSLAVRNLMRKGLITAEQITENYDTYTAYTPTDNGIEYLMQRRGELELIKRPLTRRPQPVEPDNDTPPPANEDDIPF